MLAWILELSTALFAIGGTLAVALLAYRRWRVDRDDARRADALKARRTAYTELWALVEAVHVAIRTGKAEGDDLRRRIADVNSFVLRNEVHLDDGDHDLVNQDLRATAERARWVRESGSPGQQIALESTAVVRSFSDPVREAHDLRERLKERVRAALGAAE